MLGVLVAVQVIVVLLVVGVDLLKVYLQLTVVIL
jgi:hypothetical protein